MNFEDVTPLIENVLILDSDGKRIAVKYYGEAKPSVAEQASFEKDVFSKVNRNQQRSVQADILLFNDVAVLYKRVEDLIIIVTGSQDENEVILYSVLSALSESLSTLFRGVVGKKTALENLDLVLITIDETVDDGVILEVDAAVIAQRVTMRSPSAPGETAFPESSTFSMAFANVRQQVTRSLLNV